MRKLTLVGFIIGLLLLTGGVVMMMRNSDDKPTSQPQDNSSADNQNSTKQTEQSDQASQTTPAAGAITIDKNMIFTPSQISVRKGATVTWTNNDDVAHTVVDDLSDVGGPSSGMIEPGQSYSFTFNKTGSFQYHCSIHSAMRGTVVVK